MISGSNLTRDELRALGVATLTAACTAAATGLVAWAIEEGKAGGGAMSAREHGACDCGAAGDLELWHDRWCPLRPAAEAARAGKPGWQYPRQEAALEAPAGKERTG